MVALVRKLLPLLVLTGCATADIPHDKPSFLYGCLNTLLYLQSSTYDNYTPMYTRFYNFRTCTELENHYSRELNGKKKNSQD